MKICKTEKKGSSLVYFSYGFSLPDAHVIHNSSHCMYTNSAVAAVVVEIEQNIIKRNRLEIFF
jgi:hypothetical protein